LAGETPPRFEQLALESALGKKLTESQIEKLYGLSENAFGTGLEGRARSRIANDTEAFAGGLLNPRDEQLYLQAVSSLAVPIRDDALGRTTYKIIGGSKIIEEAFAARGRNLNAFLNGEAQRAGSAAAPEVGAAAPEVGVGGAVDPRFGVGGVMMADGAAAPEVGVGGGMMEGQTPSEPEPSAAVGPTFYEQASDIGGIGSFMQRQIRRVPVGLISDSVSGEATRAANLAQNRLNDLVRVLQNNPRFSEGERNQIRADLNIEPKGIQSESDYKDKLISVGTYLRERKKQAAAIVGSDSSTLEERKWAYSVLPRIEDFLEKWGAPVEVRTPEEALKLPPGTLIVTPDGREMRVPARKSATETN